MHKKHESNSQLDRNFSMETLMMFMTRVYDYTLHKLKRLRLFDEDIIKPTHCISLWRLSDE